jgi:GT2 family glycosyltransferase
MPDRTILASVVITTRNRREDALRAVASALAQDCSGLEVMVIDDASGDGTAERIRTAFPRAHVIALSERSGYIVARNRGFREAKGRYVFSLDDDAYFSTPDTVSRVTGLFEGDATIGAVAIPYIEPLARRSSSSLARPARIEPGSEVRSYVGCAHAVRREAALALSGYRELFVHQGEERDLCLRMRAAGWRVVYGDCGRVVHMVSAQREMGRIAYYGVRNQVLFEALNAPLAYLPMRLMRTLAGVVGYEFSWSTMPQKIASLGAGLADSIGYRSERRPVARRVYREYRRLPGHGPEDWNGDVPAPCHERQAAT